MADRPRDDTGKFLPTGEAKDKTIIVRLTQLEKEQFYAAARAAGHRPSDLIRSLIEDWLAEQKKRTVA